MATDNRPVCSIRPESKRAPDWQYVFGRLDNIPIMSWLPRIGTAADLPAQELYLLDFTRVTPDERARLVAHICERFHVLPSEANEELDTQGLPLLATDLVVAIPLRLLI